MPNDPEWTCEAACGDEPGLRDADAPDEIFFEKLADLVMARLEHRLPPPPRAPEPPASPPPPLQREMRETVLLEHLASCRQAVADCLAFSRDTGQMTAARFEALGVADRLMAMSLRLSAALAGEARREVRQSITVEHIGASPARTGGGGARKGRKQFIGDAANGTP